VISGSIVDSELKLVSATTSFVEFARFAGSTSGKISLNSWSQHSFYHDWTTATHCMPRSTIQPLQRVMNAAARVIMNLSLHDHVKPALKQLHWLPVEQRITYKLCLFMHHIHTGQAPQYLPDCVSTVSALSGRYRLRSTGSADYVLPRTRFG